MNIKINCSSQPLGKSEFVGIRLRQENQTLIVNAIFPYGYAFSVEQETNKDEILSLLQCIKDNSRYIPSEYQNGPNELSGFPLDDHLFIIKDYLNNGYYVESEIEYKRANRGKIDWRKTIKKVKPLLQDDEIIYLDFIIKRKSISEELLITLIHEWCVYECFSKIGWLITTLMPSKPQLDVNSNRQYFIHVIKGVLNKTFNDRKKSLLISMVNIIENECQSGDGLFSLGTSCFHHVWEGILNTACGIPKKEKSKFHPPVVWHLVLGNAPTNPLIPDVIMKLDSRADDIFVLDAKYYGFVHGFKIIPQTSDVNKQVRYGSFAQSKFPNKNIYNAFVIPYDFTANPHQLPLTSYELIHGIGYIGHAHLEDYDINNSYESVLAIIVDTKHLIDNYKTYNKRVLGEYIIEKFRLL